MAITKPTLDIFTSPKDMGTVLLENHQINVKFTEFNIPFTDQTGNTAVNWKGKTRVILVQGFHDGSNFDGADDNAKLSDFVYEMEAWVRGSDELVNIQTSAVYTDSFGVSYNVKCFDWTWQRSFSDPFRINYSLLLKVV